MTLFERLFGRTRRQLRRDIEQLSIFIQGKNLLLDRQRDEVLRLRLELQRHAMQTGGRLHE